MHCEICTRNNSIQLCLSLLVTDHICHPVANIKSAQSSVIPTPDLVSKFLKVSFSIIKGKLKSRLMSLFMVDWFCKQTKGKVASET